MNFTLENITNSFRTFKEFLVSIPFMAQIVYKDAIYPLIEAYKEKNRDSDHLDSWHKIIKN